MLRMIFYSSAVARLVYLKLIHLIVVCYLLERPNQPAISWDRVRCLPSASWRISCSSSSRDIFWVRHLLAYW